VWFRRFLSAKNLPFTQESTKINTINIKTLETQLGDLESACIDHHPSLCCSENHLWFLSPLVSWSETVLEINHLIPLSNWSWSQSMSAISVSVLIIPNPVLISNQLVQSIITPVYKTCLMNMLKSKYHLGLSIRFVIINTLHPIRWIQQIPPFWWWQTN